MEEPMSKTTINSAKFLARLRSADDDAWASVWKEISRRLMPLYVALGLINVAEDLCSETFIKVRRTLCSSYDPEKSPLLNWLFVVGKRIGFDELRRQKRWREVPLEACDRVYFLEVCREEKLGGLSELETRVRRAYASLGEKDQSVLSQRVIEGLPIELIAENFGITESAASMRFSRALDRLWDEFERLNPRESTGRTKRPTRRHPPRTISPSSYKQAKIAKVRKSR